jgi:hypothetical protein
VITTDITSSGLSAGAMPANVAQYPPPE